jgi:hypothetical protein
MNSISFLELIELAKILECEKKLIMKLFEKIVNFTELTILNNSITIATITVLLNELPENDREIVGKELVSKLPVSTQQLELIEEVFSNSSWVSEADILLLRNRLILREHQLRSLENTLVEKNGVKRVVEKIFVEKLADDFESIVMSLVTVNKIKWDKFKLKMCTKWLHVDEETVVRLIKCGGALSEDAEERLVGKLLEVFFGAEDKAAVKVVCFRVLMRVFRLSLI